MPQLRRVAVQRTSILWQGESGSRLTRFGRLLPLLSSGQLAASGHSRHPACWVVLPIHRVVPHRPAQSLRDPVYRPEDEIFSGRRANNSTSRLCPVPAEQKADRVGLRPGKDRRRQGADRLPRCGTGAIPLHPDNACQQPRQIAPPPRRMRQKTRIGTHILPADAPPFRRDTPGRRKSSRSRDNFSSLLVGQEPDQDQGNQSSAAQHSMQETF